MSTPKTQSKQYLTTDDLPEVLAEQYSLIEKDEHLRKMLYFQPSKLLKTQASKHHPFSDTYSWAMVRSKEAVDVKTYRVAQRNDRSVGERRVVLTVQGHSFSKPVFVSRSPRSFAGQYFLWHGKEKGFDYDNGEVIKFAPWDFAKVWGHKRASPEMALAETSSKSKRPRLSSMETDTEFNPTASDEEDDIPLSQRSQRIHDKVWSAAQALTSAAASTTSNKADAPAGDAIVAETPQPSTPLTSTTNESYQFDRPPSVFDSDATTVLSISRQRVASIDLTQSNSALVVKVEPSEQKYQGLLSEEARKVNIVFINANGQECRTKMFGRCNTVGKIFMNAVAAKLLGSSEEECCLGISLTGIEDWELRLLKDDEYDEDDALYPLKAKLEEMCQCGSVGSVEVRVV